MMLKKLPLPIAGLMLGLAALGNLLQSHSETLRLRCGAFSALVGLLLIFKILLYPKAVGEGLKDPVIAGVSATFPMALMLLSVYLKLYIESAALYLWYLAIAMHIALIIYFTKSFVLKLCLTKVFTSYFIVYVGIAAASITSPAFGKQAIGKGIFYFALVSLIALMVLITLRYIKHPEVPKPAQPLICIYAAPVSLCLAGYIQSFENKSLAMITSMAVIATLLYIGVLIKLPKLLRLPFFPSYSAFTFPFVISAIALKQFTGFVKNAGWSTGPLSYVVLFETLVAVILVAYVFVRYLVFLLPVKKQEEQIVKSNV